MGRMESIKKYENKLRNLCIGMLATLYIILPNYFSIEISNALPSLTGSRMILILCIIVLLVVVEKKEIPNTNLMKSVYLYATIIIIVNILHFGDGFSYAIKSIFSIIFENIFLVYIICLLVDNKQKLEKFVEMMALTSAIVVLLAIIEFFTGYNIFYLLTTTSKEVYQAAYVRLGMTRAEASFGHSVYFGVYCSCMLPFSFYLFERNYSKIYLFVILMNIIGVVISGARGQMILCFVSLIIMFLFKEKSLRKQYIKIAGVTILATIFILLLIPSASTYIIENIKTVLNIMGFNFEISSEYGTNISGLDSRTIQLSGILWLFENKAFMFGLGSSAHIRGLVSYYWKSSGWQVVPSIDVGYVGWFLEYGIIGAVGNIFLFGKLIMHTIKNSDEKQKNQLNNPFKWFIFIYLLNLLVSTGLDKMLWMVIALSVSYERVTKAIKLQEEIINE